MIGVFARMFGSNERVLEVSEREEEGGYEVKAAGEGLETARDATVPEEVPPGFVETLRTDAGDVHLSPFVDALRSWLKKQRDNGGGEAAEAGDGAAADAGDE